MSRGAILFAFNSPKFDYYKMAVATAKRINHFLDMPVTVVTDESSVSNDPYKFDNTILVEPDKSNSRDWGMWINKGRYQAYELSPYDETLLLDTDYMVNSNKILDVFNYYDDFCCHNKTSYLMQPGLVQEVLSVYSFETLWATVVAFKKSSRTKQIFECLEMVQKNFEHYSNLHGFVAGTFRNDYAFSIAINIMNGGNPNGDFASPLPGKLYYTVDKDIVDSIQGNQTRVLVEKESFPGEYVALKTSGIDVHLMNKYSLSRAIDIYEGV